MTRGDDPFPGAGHDRLDSIDRALVQALQGNARLPNNELARRARIAPSTAHARVRALVARGVITGFHAEVSSEAVGLTLEALVIVGIRAGARDRIPAFLERMRGLRGVRQLFFLAGAEDVILHVVTRDKAALRDFVLDQLSSDPVVASTRTSLVFDHQVFPEPV